jgi:hypothetical protein
VERGLRIPRIDTVIKLARSLEISVPELLVGIEDPAGTCTRRPRPFAGVGKMAASAFAELLVNRLQAYGVSRLSLRPGTTSLNSALNKRQPARTLLPLLALSAVAVLPGCGGGSSADAAAEIGATIEEVMAHPKPTDCRTLVTQSYLVQTKQEEGETPREKCEDDVRHGLREAVDVSSVAVNGSHALAHVKIEDEAVAVAMVVALVKEEGRWKLDEIVRYLDFDRAQLLKSLERQITGSIGRRAAACVTSKLERVGSAQFEEAFLHATKLRALIVQSAKSCAHQAT